MSHKLVLILQAYLGFDSISEQEMFPPGPLLEIKRTAEAAEINTSVKKVFTADVPDITFRMLIHQRYTNTTVSRNLRQPYVNPVKKSPHNVSNRKKLGCQGRHVHVVC